MSFPCAPPSIKRSIHRRFQSARIEIDGVVALSIQHHRAAPFNPIALATDPLRGHLRACFIEDLYCFAIGHDSGPRSSRCTAGQR